MRSRIKWRKRLLTRLRTTAGPTALLTTNPTEVGPVPPDTTWATRVGRAERLPERMVCRNSSLVRMRFPRASKNSGRKLRAATAAARCEDGAPGACAHAEAEAVLLGTTTVVRLESTLGHERIPVLENAPFFRRPPLAHKQAELWARGSCRSGLSNGTGVVRAGQTGSYGNRPDPSMRHADVNREAVDFHLLGEPPDC